MDVCVVQRSCQQVPFAHSAALSSSLNKIIHYKSDLTSNWHCVFKHRLVQPDIPDLPYTRSTCPCQAFCAPGFEIISYG